MTAGTWVLFGIANTWMTPVWIFGLGAIGGLILLLVSWGVVFLVSRQAAAAVPLAVREGALWWILLVTVLLSLGALLLTPMVRQPGGLIASLLRSPHVGTWFVPIPVEAPPDRKSWDFREPPIQKFAVSFRTDELSRMTLEAKEDLEVSWHSESQQEEEYAVAPFRIASDTPLEWRRLEKGATPFPDGEVSVVYVRNYGAVATELLLTIHTDIPHPQMWMVPITAISIWSFFAIYMVIQVVFPKVSAIALATSKSEMAQPLYLISLILGGFLIMVFIFIPYNTFGEDVKMLKDSGLTLIMVLAIIVAVYAAGSSVAEEIEGRTALTVLSKPVGRRQFVFGKFLGIVQSVSVMFIVLGVVFLVMISIKVVYDARETANPDPTWQESFVEMSQTVPGLLLAFMETVVLAALSVAISTRLPLLANFVISLSVYVLGHLTPLIVQSAIAQEFAPVVFIGQLIATIVPVLDHFNIQGAVAAGVPVPFTYLLVSLGYCIIYTTIAMLLALTLFEDRDLA